MKINSSKDKMDRYVVYLNGERVAKSIEEADSDKGYVVVYYNDRKTGRVEILDTSTGVVHVTPSQWQANMPSRRNR
jgi:hypothetical protein